MLARRLKYYAYRIAPRPAAAVHRLLLRRRAGIPGTAPDPAEVSRALLAQARALGLLARDAEDPESTTDLAFRFPGVAPNQNRDEILGLLAAVRDLRPGRLCEIGTAAGGTLFLLSRTARPDARLLSIDINNDEARRERFELLMQPGQELGCLGGSSHEPETFRRFRAWLGDDLLDFLLIDGDHTFDGARLDFEMYGPFVRVGGVIAFHDIVPDFKTRYGVDTGTFAGGVPDLWSRIRAEHRNVLEFVDHPLQDGRGIGAIRVAGPVPEGG